MTLTVIWLLPMIASALIAFMPPRFAKWMGVVVAVAALGVAAGVAFSFPPRYRGFPDSEVGPRIPPLCIFFRLGRHRHKPLLGVSKAFPHGIAMLVAHLSV